MNDEISMELNRTTIEKKNSHMNEHIISDNMSRLCKTISKEQLLVIDEVYDYQ